MAEHTPGPWVIFDGSNVMAGRRSVATAGGYSTNVNHEDVRLENEANASLIAAAPDLLEAAEIGLGFAAAFAGGYLASHDEMDDYAPEHIESIHKIQDALSKAGKIIRRFKPLKSREINHGSQSGQTPSHDRRRG